MMFYDRDFFKLLGRSHMRMHDVRFEGNAFSVQKIDIEEN
jgi:hypothetical protein